MWLFLLCKQREDNILRYVSKMLRVTIEGKKLFAKFILCSNVIVMNITLISAYINGGQILVTVNQYNEGLIEVIFVPILTAWAIWTIYRKVE